jgi:hypothetical protein
MENEPEAPADPAGPAEVIEITECVYCGSYMEVGAGIVLEKCLHNFCRQNYKLIFMHSNNSFLSL